MAKAKFEDLLYQLGQDGAAYDEARRRLISNSIRFWKDLCVTAQHHPDPIIRAKVVSVISGAKKVPLPQRREVLEMLAQTETHEIPIRSLKFILNYSLR